MEAIRLVGGATIVVAGWTASVLVGKAVLGAFSITWFPPSYMATATLAAGVLGWMAVGIVIGGLISQMIFGRPAVGSGIGLVVVLEIAEISFILVGQLIISAAIGAAVIALPILLVKALLR